MNIGKDKVGSRTDLKYFGTDGFRGEANVKLTAIHAYKIGRFLGWYFKSKASNSNKVRILVGKDTRKSSDMLERAISAGITASGADVYLMNVITTPSISYICRCENFSCGVMISASHNPYYDNGIKLISSSGEKLDNAITYFIEDYLDGNMETLGLKEDEDLPYAVKTAIGSIINYEHIKERYIDYLKSTVSVTFENLRIGLDCANGAAWQIAPLLFDILDATTFVIGNTPDGININTSCGSTNIDQLQKLVVSNNLDVGFAFDGDADRCIAVDVNGDIVNGDKILYILSKRFKRQNILNTDTTVATIMSNIGLVRSLKSIGINTSLTNVGDKYVYQRMIENDYQLGGEQSGHIIMKPYAVTGDGILTALILADEIISTGKSISELCEDFIELPQISVNFAVKDKNIAINDPEIQKAVSDYKQDLGDNGKIILRVSGTEDLLRLSVEAPEGSECERYVKGITELLQKGGHLI